MQRKFMQDVRDKELNAKVLGNRMPLFLKEWCFKHLALLQLARAFYDKFLSCQEIFIIAKHCKRLSSTYNIVNKNLNI